VKVTLEAAVAVVGQPELYFIALDRALDKLAQLPRQCRIVEMRFFGGLMEEEIAEVLDISPNTESATGGLQG
jgi:DNA-directed RNA polymerase specialized sigma24 family protein